MTGDTPLISARSLGAVFDVSKPWLNRMLAMESKRFLTAVDTVDFDIPKGKTFALVGESGSGKSTIGRMIVGLQKPTSGQVLIDGEDFFAIKDQKRKLAMRRRIQMIFQSPYASLNPRWRVRHIIGEPIRAFELMPASEVDKRVAELLDQVGLAKSDGEKFPHEFSGGQRQRIAIARALASNPEFIVCDEPTSALDVSVQSQVLNLMKTLQRELGLTYLFISHDLAVVDRLAHRVAVLRHGAVVELGTPARILREPAEEYTRRLIAAIPEPRVTRDRP